MKMSNNLTSVKILNLALAEIPTRWDIIFKKLFKFKPKDNYIKATNARGPISNNGFQFALSDDLNIVNEFLDFFKLLMYANFVKSKVDKQTTWVEPYLYKGLSASLKDTATAPKTIDYYFPKGKIPVTKLSTRIAGEIYQRSFTKLKGITTETENILRKTIAEGKLKGFGVDKITNNIYSSVGDLTKARVKRIVRTELLGGTRQGNLLRARAYAEELNIPALVDWATSRLPNVRDTHRAREGMTYTVLEAESLIYEPNCNCIVVPRLEPRYV